MNQSDIADALIALICEKLYASVSSVSGFLSIVLSPSAFIPHVVLYSLL